MVLLILLGAVWLLWLNEVTTGELWALYWRASTAIYCVRKLCKEVIVLFNTGD